MYVLYTGEVMAIEESSGLLTIPSEISVKVTTSGHFFKNHFPPLLLFIVFLTSNSCKKTSANIAV